MGADSKAIYSLFGLCSIFEIGIYRHFEAFLCAAALHLSLAIDYFLAQFSIRNHQNCHAVAEQTKKKKKKKKAQTIHETTKQMESNGILFCARL